MGQLYKYVEGMGVVPIEQAPRSENATAYVRDDTMPPTEHPCDGKLYDSKSVFRRVTRSFGCEERGNDLITREPKPEKRDTLPWDRIRQTLREKLNG